MQLRLDIIVQVSEELHHPANRRVSSQLPTQGQKDRTNMAATQSTRQPSGPTARSVDKKVTDLAARNTADHEALTARLNGHDRSFKLASKNNERLARLVAQLGERVATDHDSVVADVAPRLQKLEERVANGMSLELASKVSGFTPDEVKEILRLQAEEQLDDSTFVTAMVDTIRWLKVQVNILTEESAVHRQELDEHKQRLNGHDTRLDAIDGPEGQLTTLRNALYADLNQVRVATDRSVRRTINEDLKVTSRVSKWGIVPAIFVFVAIWLIVWLSGSNLAGKVTQNGKNVGTWHANIHFGWVGFFLGLLAAGIVLLLAQRTKLTIKQSETTESVETANGNANNGSNNAGRPQPQPPVDTTPIRELQPVRTTDKPQPAHS